MPKSAASMNGSRRSSRGSKVLEITLWILAISMYVVVAIEMYAIELHLNRNEYSNGVVLRAIFWPFTILFYILRNWLG